jgi:glycerol-3-phosphate dehydrogenase (NAD(P)+)
MKNAYAMGVSLAVGMAEQEVGVSGSEISVGKCVSGAPDENPVYNPQAALFAQSCLEMRRLVSMLGANPDLVCGVAGAGDLYVTIFGGRTRKLGTLLGRGIPYEKAKELLSHVTLEAVSITTRMAEALRVRAENGKVELKDFPLLMHMAALINGGASINLDWNSFGETGI